MAEFPFFKSNTADFPGLTGLDGQSYRDTYDYTKYQRPAVLRLLNVPWRSDYRDTVRFADERARDTWLSQANPETIEYSTPWLRIPAQSVNVPLPYERAAHFNYLYVDVPVLPVDASTDPTRLCYFIRSISYAAPSTTTLELELDFWQTYIYRMNLESIILERGHAPMRRVTVDEFLSDPISNNRYLLAKDIDFSSGSDRIAGLKHYPIGSGDKAIVMALPIVPENIPFIGEPEAASVTPPTYSDTAARNGYQYAVSDYDWGFGGLDYSSSMLPALPCTTSDDRTLDGTFLYAIPAEFAYDALNDISFFAPHVLQAIKYLAIVPLSFCQRHPWYPEPEEPEPGEEPPTDPGIVEIAGNEWSVISANPNVTLDGFELSRDSIGLPDYAADIAKLYTYPYTRLEISDNEGRSFEVRIEDIAGDTLDVMLDISLASSSMICNIECPNIGTGSTYTLDWKLISGDTLETTLYGSDLYKHVIEWGIPTYEVSAWAYPREVERRDGTFAAERQGALNAYHQSVRSANTSLANTNATNYIINTNAGNTANTNTANTTATNTNATDNTTEETTARSGIAGWQNTITTNNKSENNSLNDDRVKTANDIQALALVQGQDFAAISAATSIGASLTGIAGSVMTGNVQGAAAGAANVIGTAVVTHTAITNDANLSQAVIDANTYMKGRADNAATEIALNTNSLNSNVVSYQNDQSTHTTTNNNTLRSTLTTNNNTLLTGNTANTTGVSDSNAGYVRSDAIEGAKENLELAQQRAEGSLAAYAQEAIKIGSISGDNTLDAMARRAFIVRARTQSDYALRATAEYFTRYGYALDAPIYPNSWLEQGDYCYWQGSRAIIKGNVPDMYRTALEAILEQGVTVWESPEKVGDYGI